MTPERIDEAVLAELFTGGVEGLGNAIGVEHECVAGSKLDLAYGAIPSLKQADDRAGRVQALDAAGAAQDQRRQVATVDVTEAARAVVVVGVEERRVGASPVFR